MKNLHSKAVLLCTTIFSFSFGFSQTVIVHSDNSWKTSNSTMGGGTTWTQENYNDSNWGTSVYANTLNTTGCNSWRPEYGSLMWVDSTNATDTALFRKEFYLDGICNIDSAADSTFIKFLADDRIEVFINGVSLSGGEVALASYPVVYRYAAIYPLLHAGNNIIAISARNINNPCWWAYFEMEIRSASCNSTTPCQVWNDFDDSTIGSSSVKEHAFYTHSGVGQPLEGFVSTHASPSIAQASTLGIQAVSGSQVALIGACGNNQSEGLAYNYNFLVGHTYHLKFYYRYAATSGSLPIEDVDVYLASGFSAQDQGGCSSTLAVPTANQNIFSQPNFNNASWVQADLYITPNANYSQLWFRVNTAAARANAGFFLIDDFCMDEVSCKIGNSFDNSIVGTTPVKENAFALYNGVGQPLENFISTNGSPSIMLGSNNGFQAPSGDQVALVGACGNNQSEGLGYNFNFQPSHTYRLKFEYRYLAPNGTNPIEDVDVYLTNGLTANNQGGCSATPPVPALSQSLFQQSAFNNTSWQQADISFTPNSNYGQLWFRVNTAANRSEAGYFLIDNFCIDSSSTTSINNIDNSLSEATLYNYPNPFSDKTTIHYSISRGNETNAQIEIYNIYGQLIRKILIENEEGDVTVDNLANGSYFYSLKVNERIYATNKMITIK